MAGLMMGLLVVVMLVVPWLVAGQRAENALPDREARLWIALGLVQVTIWSTLGPAQVLAAALRARGLLNPVATGVIVVGAVVVAGLWSRRRPGILEVVAAIGVASAYLMVIVRTGLSPAERTHLFEYGIVAVLAYEALRERRRAGRKSFHPWPTALLLAITLGVIDEGLQDIVPNRVFDLTDVIFNTLAVTMALISVAVMGLARRVARERRASR